MISQKSMKFVDSTLFLYFEEHAMAEKVSCPRKIQDSCLILFQLLLSKTHFLGRHTFDEFHQFWAQNYNIYNYFDYTDTQKQKKEERSNTFLDNFYKSSD